jgi:hypothetical protein
MHSETRLGEIRIVILKINPNVFNSVVRNKLTTKTNMLFSKYSLEKKHNQSAMTFLMLCLPLLFNFYVIS